MFDPSAPAIPDPRLVFGIPATEEESRLVILGVPFDATTSYRSGTADGPEAIRRASQQVDLLDRRFGNVYEHGIWMAPEREEFRALSADARQLAAPIIEKAGADPDDPADAEAIGRINEITEHVRANVHGWAKRQFASGKIPAVLGGEHSVSLGILQAAAEATADDGGIGILQIDAHMDLRRAYEGFRHSHASISYNAMEALPPDTKLVQLGIRDYCQEELEYAQASRGRIVTFYWDDVADQLAGGITWRSIAEEVLNELPRNVHVTFDIDGLDPSLCPNTGTPVPGGLSFQQASMLLEMLAKSGRRIVSFDLVETNPGVDSDWDANVAARLLYRLCGAASLTLG